MKFIGKVLVTLLVLVLLVAVALYVAVQTRWGAARIAGWVSDHSSWQLSLGGIDHSLRHPAQLTLEEVSLAPKNGQPVLSAKTMVLDLSIRQLTAPRHFDTLTVQQGNITLDTQRRLSLPLKADALRLQNMRVDVSDGSWQLHGERVDGGITPWLPTRAHLLGSDARFQFSAGELTLNDIPARNALVQGKVHSGLLLLSNLGADVARGQLTGNAQQEEDGSWLVDNLRLSGIRWQTTHSLEQLGDSIKRLPKITLGRLDVTGAKLVGPAWALSDLDVTLQDVTLQGGSWHSEDGALAFNASDIITGNLHFIDPIVSTTLSPAGVTIKQLTTRWEGGLLRASGAWQRATRSLIVDDAAIVGLEYTLPQEWRELWQRPLPAWLNTLTLTKFSGSRNLVVDINPAFPFQFTALDGFGNNLTLVKDGQWGIWGGGFTLNGSEATLNKRDIRRPSITLNADAQQINVTELSAFSDKGLMEATASVSQLPERAFSLTLNGRGVPADTLTQWGWPTLPLSGDVNLQLSAQGQLRADAPLKPTISAALHAQDGAGHQITQTLVAGELQATTPSSPAPAAPEPQPVPVAPSPQAAPTAQ